MTAARAHRSGIRRVASRIRPVAAPLFALAAAGLAAAWLAAAPRTVAPEVTLVPLPAGAVQPQVAIDAAGTIHVVYFRGDAAHGDLAYATLDPDSLRFTPAMRVNTQPGSAIATGSMRGAQLAIGAGGRVHVIWNGSDRAAPRAADGSAPVLYARLNDARTAFEPQRNLVRASASADGSTIAADVRGHVYAAWHALVPNGQSEADRRLWVARSDDDGRTFAPEIAASPAASGACGCCGVRALVDRRGALRVLFRTAVEMTHRDTYLLTSYDQGATFVSDLMQPWNIGACPMSTFGLFEAGTQVLATWETAGQLQWLRIDEATNGRSNWTTPTGHATNRRYPSIAGNARGDVVLAWIEGASWNRGGSLAWQVFSPDGTAAGPIGRKTGTPAWDTPAVAVRPDGRFLVLY